MEDEIKKEELQNGNSDAAAAPIRKRCPKCGSNMKLRKGEFGSYYGCSRFPVCNYTEKAGE